MQVMQALSQHCSTYLSDPEWTELPWKGSTKTIFDRLLDLLMIATHFYEQIHLLGKTIESASSFLPLLKIVKRGWTIDAELLRLHKELEDTTLGPVYWPKFSTEPNSADDLELGKLFPVAFHFQNL